MKKRCHYKRRGTTSIDNLEKTCSDALAVKLGGKREVTIKETGRRIDILTKTQIIEVKKYDKRFSAIGQILDYGSFYPNRTKHIHLFDCDEQRDPRFEQICEKIDIVVSYEDPDPQNKTE